MTDLETRLRELRVPTVPASDEVVHADVVRARRALQRRRLARRGSGGVAVAAAAVLAAVVVSGQSGGTGSRPDIADHAPSSAGVRLVDYTGVQRPGFTVAKVPAGFVLQGATPYALDIARADDHSGLNVFKGKLVVMLQSKDVTFRHTGHPVSVHGTTGYLRTEKGGATALEYLDGSHDVVVQAWANLGLTDAQLVEFANGVTVSHNARATVG